MVIKNVSLETVCGITSKLPENIHPEVAFAGKSNVGKSSLINGLMNRKSLARTSSQPGKTQTINYYNINDEIYLRRVGDGMFSPHLVEEEGFTYITYIGFVSTEGISVIRITQIYFFGFG